VIPSSKIVQGKSYVDTTDDFPRINAGCETFVESFLSQSFQLLKDTLGSLNAGVPL
jgi:hypothetical protein